MEQKKGDPVEKPNQEDQNLHQYSLLRNAWVRLAIALGILLTVALLAALAFLVRWYFTTDLTVTARKDLVQGLASVAQAVAVLLTGVVALLGLYFTRRNTDRQLAQARESTNKQLEQARESQERTQASARETLQLTERGQITERFTRAIDQLGASHENGEPKLEIRLGGIYALERIARDSPERDYSTVMEVLTAYVQENTPWRPKEAAKDNTMPEDTRQEGGDDRDSKDNTQDETTTPPETRADIKAILDVLRRREENRIPEERRVPLDLRRANLQGANLQGANLQGANLHEAKGLVQEQLDRAIIDDGTLLPEDLAKSKSSTDADENKQTEDDE
jgi:membrane protein implicated in regulation of membrane protease activity